MQRRVGLGPVAMRLVPLVWIACAAFVGCGSDSKPASSQADAKSKPDVAGRIVQEDEFLGLRVNTMLGNVVRTEAIELSKDLPGLYADPEQGPADARRDGFVAGILKLFKNENGPNVAIHVVVQMRDEKGAAAEFDRQVEALSHLPCPPGTECDQETEPFDVPGIPGASGVSTKQTIEGAGSLHPDVLRGDTIVFRNGKFVEQVFRGSVHPPKQRAALLEATRGLYAR